MPGCVPNSRANTRPRPRRIPSDAPPPIPADSALRQSRDRAPAPPRSWRVRDRDRWPAGSPPLLQQRDRWDRLPTCLLSQDVGGATQQHGCDRRHTPGTPMTHRVILTPAEMRHRRYNPRASCASAEDAVFPRRGATSSRFTGATRDENRFPLCPRDGADAVSGVFGGGAVGLAWCDALAATGEQPAHIPQSSGHRRRDRCRARHLPRSLRAAPATGSRSLVQRHTRSPPGSRRRVPRRSRSVDRHDLRVTDDDSAQSVPHRDCRSTGELARRRTTLRTESDFPAHTVRVWKRLRDDEQVYGFGEKTGRFNKRGGSSAATATRCGTATRSRTTTSTDPIYVSVPFYLGPAQRPHARHLSRQHVPQQLRRRPHVAGPAVVRRGWRRARLLLDLRARPEAASSSATPR